MDTSIDSGHVLFAGTENGIEVSWGANLNKTVGWRLGHSVVWERMLRFHVDRCGEPLQTAGAIETVVVHQMRDTGWHLLGNCKIGDNPKNSVVDQWGRSHDLPNLYVFDASAFPTPGGANPTATIMAVALQQCRHPMDGETRRCPDD